MSTGAGFLLIDESTFEFSFETALEEEDDAIVSLPLSVFQTRESLPPPATRALHVVPRAHLHKPLLPELTRQPKQVKMHDLFSPLSPLVRWLEEQRTGCRSCHEEKVTWQHRLLYQTRSYVPSELLEGTSRVGRLSAKLKPYAFYRRLVMNFEENWHLLTPLLLTKESIGDEAGAGVCGFLLLPFVFVSYRLTPQSVAEYHELTRARQSPMWSSVLGPASLCALQLPTDLDLIRPPQPLSCRHSSALERAFNTPLFAFSRIVIRANQSVRHHPCLYHALLGAAQENTLTLISSQSVRRPSEEESSPEDRELISSEPCKRSENERSLDVEPHGELGRAQLKSGHSEEVSVSTGGGRKNVYKLIFLLGGKDMLALDWLPFVSQALKIFSVMRMGTTESFQQACRFGVSFLMYEYPGYGFKSGLSSPQSCAQAALETLLEALGRFPEESQISLTLVGYSLGSAIALRLARRLVEATQLLPSVTLSKVTLLAPITKLAECAAYLLQVPRPLQGITANALAWLQDPCVAWDTQTDLIAFIDHIAQNVEAFRDFRLDVFHGDRDDMVSPALSRGLIESARERLAAHINCNKNVDGQKANSLHQISDHIQFHNVVGANHLSLAANAKFTTSIHQSLFEGRFVSLAQVVAEESDETSVSLSPRQCPEFKQTLTI